MPEDYGLDAAALEQRVAELSDDEFDALVARTRPPRIPQGPKGNVVPGVGGTPGRGSVAGSAIAAAEQSGDWKRSFELKQAQLAELMRKNHR